MGHNLKWQRYICIVIWYEVWSSIGSGLRLTNSSCPVPGVAERLFSDTLVMLKCHHPTATGTEAPVFSLSRFGQHVYIVLLICAFIFRLLISGVPVDHGFLISHSRVSTLFI